MSTALGSAARTSRVIEPLVEWLRPGASAADVDFAHFLVRKAAHLTEYAILATLIFRALRITWPRRFTQSSDGRSAAASAFAIALVVSAAYAATDEFHQSFIPGRESCVRDVLIDSSGALGGLMMFLLVTWLLRRPTCEELPS